MGTDLHLLAASVCSLQAAETLACRTILGKGRSRNPPSGGDTRRPRARLPTRPPSSLADVGQGRSRSRLRQRNIPSGPRFATINSRGPSSAKRLLDVSARLCRTSSARPTGPARALGHRRRVAITRLPRVPELGEEVDIAIGTSGLGGYVGTQACQSPYRSGGLEGADICSRGGYSYIIRAVLQGRHSPPRPAKLAIRPTPTLNTCPRQRFSLMPPC